MSVTNVGYNAVSQVPFNVEFISAFRENKDTVTSKQTASQQRVKPQVIQSATSDLQRIGQVFNRRLQFEVDQNSNQVIVKVIDKETDKVIMELPPEELQRLHKHIKQAIGLLFNEMA
jgi:flagellar protein FlaG